MSKMLFNIWICRWQKPFLVQCLYLEHGLRLVLNSFLWFVGWILCCWEHHPLWGTHQPPSSFILEKLNTMPMKRHFLFPLDPRPGNNCLLSVCRNLTVGRTSCCHQARFICPTYSEPGMLRFAAEKGSIQEADKPVDGRTYLRSTSWKARYLQVFTVFTGCRSRVVWGVGSVGKGDWKWEKSEAVVLCRCRYSYVRLPHRTYIQKKAAFSGLFCRGFHRKNSDGQSQHGHSNLRVRINVTKHLRDSVCTLSSS